MVLLRFILTLALVILNLTDAVKVDVKGALSLGKDVVEALQAFFKKDKINGRRVLGSAEDEEATEKDIVALIVHSSFICRKIQFCEGDLGRFVSQYLITLTKSIENVFSDFIDDADKNHNYGTLRAVIFEEQLKQLIRYVKMVLKNASLRIKEANEPYIWINLLKRINAKFQDTAIEFGLQRLEGNIQDLTKVKTKLAQKLIIATSYVELKFIDRLCVEHNISSRSYEATKGVNTLLLKIGELSESKVKEFIRHFYETLPSTNFYYRINDVTGHEFQTVLQDMAYADNIPTKDVFAIVQKTVQERLDAVENRNREDKSDTISGRDVTLVHVVLSDLDHFYSKHKKEPFHDFLGDFFEWAKSGGKFRSQMRRMMKDLQNGLTLEADELVFKLINEVKVFMEITVDPDP